MRRVVREGREVRDITCAQRAERERGKFVLILICKILGLNLIFFGMFRWAIVFFDKIFFHIFGWDPKEVYILIATRIETSWNNE
jgi:hypothetical protein